MRPIPSNIGEYIAYEPETGILRRIRDYGSTAKAGEVVGSKNQMGRWRLSFMNQTYSAHRVAWFLMTGKQPGNIDHIDMNPLNNAWSNLREATLSQNGANQRTKRQGRKGVALQRSGRYTASIKCQNKSYYLGSFATEDEAGDAYAAKARELFGEYARIA